MRHSLGNGQSMTTASGRKKAYYQEVNDIQSHGVNERCLLIKNYCAALH
jgi:hypothetical protein